MSRAARRKAQQLRDEWVQRLTGSAQVRHVPTAEENEDGRDYADAPTAWVCNRKKSYPEQIARVVARRMNEENRTGRGRPEFAGVVVNPYYCRRCGRWHIGR